MRTNRHLKIFISSTFEDMHLEREILLKEVFLELKQIAKQRDVEITEIDLRWGITAEQAENGHTVKACLDEIERCKDSPIFFLGMLGHRYGWCDWYKATHLKILENERYTWIKEYVGKSITELEISAVLRREKTHNKAFVYLKEDGAADDDERLTELKQDLISRSEQNAQLYVDTYGDLEAFKVKVIESFIATLDELYPQDVKVSELEKMRYNHILFAKSRTALYISHEDNEKILDEFLLGEKDRLLLYGASGLGKSALVANYFDAYKKNHDTFVVEHYIGGAGELSSDLSQMLRRIILEIKEKYAIDDTAPSDPQQILTEFAMWLGLVKSPMIIVLDGYNQIADDEKRKLFAFLPKRLQNVKLIITSIRDDYAIEHKRQISPLSRVKQEKLVRNYFESFRKNLTDDMINTILDHPLTDNTLFLKTLLNEIRLVGKFETLEQDIEKYLQAQSIVGLFELLFERFEEDYTDDISKEILTLIYASRDGLSEDNLMEIINANREKNKLTRLDFSPAFLAILDHLVNRNGVYNFFHTYIEEAVKHRYLSEDTLLPKRREIANYFMDREIDQQRVRELPYQLLKINDQEKLSAFLVEILSTKLILEIDEVELLTLYNEVKNVDSIINTINQKALLDDHEFLLDYAKFLYKVYGKKHKRAIDLLNKVLHDRISIYGENSIECMEVYGALSDAYRVLGDMEKAYPYYVKNIEIKEEKYKNRYVELAEAYHNYAVFLRQKSEYEKAEKLLLQVISLREKYLGNYHQDTSSSYLNIALVYKLQKKYRKSCLYNYKSLKIRQTILDKNHPALATNYTNIANLYMARKEFPCALWYFRKGLNLKKKIYGFNHPSLSYSYNGLCKFFTFLKKGRKAIRYGQNALIIHKSFLGEEHINTGIIYLNMADAYYSLGRLDNALNYYKKSLTIALKLNRKSDITNYLNKKIFKIKSLNYLLYLLNPTSPTPSCHNTPMGKLPNKP